MTRVAAEVGLPFDLPAQQRTPNTLAAHRLIWWAGRLGRQDALVEALFSAYFSAGLDVGDPAVLVRLAAGTGCDAGEAARFLASSEGVEEVLAEEGAVRRQGAGGVPLFIINGHERVSGAQSAAVFSVALLQASEASAVSEVSAASGAASGSDPSGCVDGVCRA